MLKILKKRYNGLQETIKLKIIVPDRLFFGETFNEDSLKEIEGYVEQAYLELKDGDEINS